MYAESGCLLRHYILLIPVSMPFKKKEAEKLWDEKMRLHFEVYQEIEFVSSISPVPEPVSSTQSLLTK